MRKERQRKRNESNFSIVETWRGTGCPKHWWCVGEHVNYESGALFLRPDGGKLRPISIGKGYHHSIFRFFPGMVCANIEWPVSCERDTPTVTVMVLQKSETLRTGEDVCLGKIIAEANMEKSGWQRAIPEKFHPVIRALLHRMIHPDIRGPIWAESELY